jgi:hypothetical protein
MQYAHTGATYFSTTHAPRTHASLAKNDRVVLIFVILPFFFFLLVFLRSNVALQHILIPKRNAKDLQDLPESVKKDVKFTLCAKIEDVLMNAFASEGTR